MNDQVQRVHERIDKELARRHANRVLHGHPSPMFWLERDLPVADIVHKRNRPGAGVPRGLIAYVGTPFCLPTTPDRCGFCLFPSEVYRSPDQLVTYLRYLAKEAELYRGWFDDTEVAAIYFGGGTTNLYRPQQYAELLAIVRRLLPRAAPSQEVTIEGVAQLFTQAKLEAMRDTGVNRISLGVQQLDPALLEASGRKQNAAHVLRMLESCHALGLGINVDLIFGWPGQTLDHMRRDLETLVQHRVHHITHYALNVAGRTDFARNRRDQLPSVQETREMYRAAKQFLAASGYRQATPYDWERIDAGEQGKNLYEVLGRTPFERDAKDGITGYDGFGLGFAGISAWFGSPEEPGWIYANCPRVEDYYRRLDEGGFPVERGYRYTDEDLRLFTLFQMLQGLSVDRALHRRLFGIDPIDEHAATWQALCEREWAAITAERVTVVGDGGFHIPMLQSLFAAGRLEEMRRARRGRRDAHEMVVEPETAEVAG
jgi:oxygen-independent coproporphyrinogen-3 oxidase